MIQHEINLKARHLRKVFFIDDSCPYELIRKIVLVNQMQWGGRYNPIVPIKENIILSEYDELLNFYDPDYIFYTSGIDPTKLKGLNPQSLILLHEENIDLLEDGVRTSYLNREFGSNFHTIISKGDSLENNFLADFFELNFGVSKVPDHRDYTILKDAKPTIIQNDNFNEITKIIYQQKPSTLSGSSRIGDAVKVLKSQHVEFQDLEIIISKDKKSKDDLIYYWNRLLYQGKQILLICLEELEILVKDLYFGGILYNLSFSQRILIVSKSVEEEHLTMIIKKLSESFQDVFFRFKDISDFPYMVDSVSESSAYGKFIQPVKSQLLFQGSGVLEISNLQFIKNESSYRYSWAIDLSIHEVHSYGKSRIDYPLTLNTASFFDVKGRIRKDRAITAFIDNRQNLVNSIKLRIPSLNEVATQLICYPNVNGTLNQSEFERIGTNDSSNRLQGFIKLFNNDLRNIESFFSDIFWVKIFENLILSNKAAGDCISFNDLVNFCLSVFNDNGIEVSNSAEQYNNIENLKKGLKSVLEELCFLKVLLIGIKLKCSHCSNISWYSLPELEYVVTCKGCLDTFLIPVESQFFYKLNDLIQNNIFSQNFVGNQRQRDGNLAVVRTLAHLSLSSHKSFRYLPQMDLFGQDSKKKPINELDIFCIVDGRLIIGEVKHNSNLFSAKKSKCLEAIRDVAIQILPDEIVLACYEDQNGNLDKAKKSLAHLCKKLDYYPKITSVLLSAPDAFHLESSRYFFD